MAAKDRAGKDKRIDEVCANERGQSVLEFIFMLPILLGLIVVMVRTNTAIQMSIVNQRYAREQATWLTFNSPYYPRLSFRKEGSAEDQFIKTGFNRMVIGMADQPVDDTGGTAVAVTQVVARDTGAAASDGPAQAQPEDRSKVRIRTTVALCTQTNVVVTPQGVVVASAENIGEKTVFDFCRGQDQ